MKKILLLLIALLLFNQYFVFGASNNDTVNINVSVTPGDPDPFNVIPGPSGSKSCILTWHTSVTPNIDTQELWIWGLQGPGIISTSRDLTYPGPSTDETLTIENLLIGEPYTFNLFSIAGVLRSSGVWTTPPTCTPTTPLGTPVIDAEPINTFGTSNTVDWNPNEILPSPAGFGDLECNVGLNTAGYTDPFEPYLQSTGWVPCEDPATWTETFSGLTLNETYYYRMQVRQLFDDPVTDYYMYSEFSPIVQSTQVAFGDPVLTSLSTTCGTSRTANWVVGAPYVRCQATASVNPLFDDLVVPDIKSAWMDCSGGTGTYTFPGLTTGETYYYRVLATSEAGPGDPTGGFSAYSGVLSALQSACGRSSSTPNPYCGDGTVNTAGEECDDGNTRDGDGCSTACKLEVRPAAAVCGDNFIDAPEECDDGNTRSGDGCSDVCMSEEIVNVTFTIKAKPEYRTPMATHPNLGLNAAIAFYKPSNGSLTADSVVLDNYGNAVFNALLYTGVYDIGLNGESHNTKAIRGIDITKYTESIVLDFTDADTWALTAGDTKDNNQVDALDMAKLIAGYKATGGVNDLNKAGGVNAMDVAILIWNYRKVGDPLGGAAAG